jgi:multicomponent Na+:H+ antiporter subunit G
VTVGAVMGGALIAAGCFFFLAGTLGLLRFPDTLSRLHALTKADNLGLGLVCAGLAVVDGTAIGIGRLALIWLLTLTASTLSAFFIARWHRTQPRRDGDAPDASSG